MLDKHYVSSQAYLEALAAESHESALDEALGALAADDTLTLSAVHAHIGMRPDNPTDPAQPSVAQRLSVANAHSLPDTLLDEDPAGRVRLKTVPRWTRSAIAPVPWWKKHSPMVRLWHALCPWGRKARAERDAADSEQPPLHRRRWQRVGMMRRTVLLFLVIVQSLMAVSYMTTVLPNKGGTLLEVAVLVLFGLLFIWVSSGFWTALMGFIQLLKGRDRYSISASSAEDTPIESGARTALVMPICNEDVNRVFAGLKATYLSLKESGQLALFDIYICSDSFDPDTCVQENQAWLELCREVDGFNRIFYRRRRRRVKRKSGNIDDWCRRFGRQYRYMVILDADSVMTGRCLTRLVQLMEANPDAGLIQSAPVSAGGTNLYARLQQFATRVYGPLFTAGLHFWQLGESHYWGHNAIIRVAPFMKHCILAPLPGKGSLSGPILSHDFVEAALMRRAGYGVWIAYDLPGSYEEMPPNLIDELQRDRRWCHGNLMNFRLFWAKGMHPVHRAVFLTGVMSYLSAPLWFLFLVLSTALMATNLFSDPVYFTKPGQLIADWRLNWYPWRAVALFSATLTLLFLPKILSLVWLCSRGASAYGGALRLILSVVLESLVSMLLAPVRMLFHTRFVISILCGLKAKWTSPDRESSETTWKEAVYRHGGQTLLGCAWIALVLWMDPRFLLWFSPIVGALVVSIPVSVLTSKVSVGMTLQRWGILRIPEEVNPGSELLNTWKFTREARMRSAVPGFVYAVVDPLSNAVNCALGTARHGVSEAIEISRQGLVRKALVSGPDRLAAADRLALLDDPVMLSRLHYSVWENGGRYPLWHQAYEQATHRQ